MPRKARRQAGRVSATSRTGLSAKGTRRLQRPPAYANRSPCWLLDSLMGLEPRWPHPSRGVEFQGEVRRWLVRELSRKSAHAMFVAGVYLPGVIGSAATLKPLVAGKRGVVAAGHPLVAEAGLRILEKGGNAVDAGVATLFAASVVEMASFGAGGECPILIKLKDGPVVAINGDGIAPELATVEFYEHLRRDDPRLVSLGHDRQRSRRDHPFLRPTQRHRSQRHGFHPPGAREIRDHEAQRSHSAGHRTRPRVSAR